MLKAILFDLDDTLIDWTHFGSNWKDVETRHLAGVFAYHESCGHPPHSLDRYKQEYVKQAENAWEAARSTLDAPHLGRVLVATAVALGVPEASIDERACLEAFAWSKIEGTVVFPEVIAALENLRDRGLRFGIVTNAFQPMWMRDVELAAHGLLDFFPECRFSAADVGRLKPDRAIFQAALDCLGTTPKETVFVGDTPKADIAGAQGLGMRAVLRQRPRSRRLPLGRVVPDAVILTLNELPRWLDQWYPK